MVPFGRGAGPAALTLCSDCIPLGLLPQLVPHPGPLLALPSSLAVPVRCNLTWLML